MEYRDVLPIDKQTAELIFDQDDENSIPEALLSLVFYDPDLEWVLEKCIHFSKHQSVTVRRIAVTCFGHLARIHKKLDLEKVMPILSELQKDSLIAPTVQDTIDDIETFLPYNSLKAKNQSGT